MIKVIRNKKYIRKYSFDMLWASCKPLIILNFAILPFMIFFLLVGIFSDKEAFNYFCHMIICFILSLAINIRMYFYYKKSNQMFFNTCDEDGNVEEIITLENDEYVINNTTQKTINRIKKSEIKSISLYNGEDVEAKSIYSKTCIFDKYLVELTNGQKYILSLDDTMYAALTCEENYDLFR